VKVILWWLSFEIKHRNRIYGDQSPFEEKGCNNQSSEISEEINPAASAWGIANSKRIEPLLYLARSDGRRSLAGSYKSRQWAKLLLVIRVPNFCKISFALQALQEQIKSIWFPDRDFIGNHEGTGFSTDPLMQIMKKLALPR